MSGRAFTDTKAIAADLIEALATVRAELKPVDGTPADDAFAHVETFCAVALRVFAKTNPSKIRDEARTVEIAARINGRQVLEPSRSKECSN